MSGVLEDGVLVDLGGEGSEQGVGVVLETAESFLYAVEIKIKKKIIIAKYNNIVFYVG